MVVTHAPGSLILAIAFGAMVLGAAPAFPPQDLATRAHRLDLDGQHAEAVALYRQALAQDPDSFDAQYGIGRALDLAGGYAEAREHFAKALALAPEGLKDQTQRMMAISYVFTGNTAEAAADYRQVYDRDIAAKNSIAAGEVADELGRLYLETGDAKNAYTWYRTGYDTATKKPDRAPWEVNLADMRWAHAQARIAARNGDFTTAREQETLVKRALDKGTNPDQQIQYAYLLGYVAFYEKDYPTAVAQLEKADQSDPFILFLLAQSSEKLNQIPQARTYYEKTLASPSHAISAALVRPRAQDALARLRGR